MDQYVKVRLKTDGAIQRTITKRAFELLSAKYELADQPQAPIQAPKKKAVVVPVVEDELNIVSTSETENSQEFEVTDPLEAEPEVEGQPIKPKRGRKPKAQ